ncbi:unnamed protein product [Brassica oleracea]
MLTKTSLNPSIFKLFKIYETLFLTQTVCTKDTTSVF